MDKQLPPIKHVAILGQVSSLAIILVFLVLAVVITGVSVSRLQSGTTQRILDVKNMDAAYTFAMSGIQEAIATRMSPRSNFLALENKQTPSGTIGQNFRPYQGESGYVYKDPTNKTELVGMYRYFILGGDPARDPASGNWWVGNNIPSTTPGIPTYTAIGGNARHLLDILPQQPLIIVSRGSACINPKSRLIASNQLQYPLNGSSARIPRCVSSSFTLFEQTILAVYDMSRSASVQSDKIVDYRLFSSAEYAPGFVNDVTIPNNVLVSITDSPAYNPNTPLNTFNFQRVWQGASSEPGYQTDPSQYTAPFAAWVPAAVSFYNLSATSPYWFETLSFSGTPATANLDAGHPAVDAKSAIKIQFRGPVDFLSMFADQKTRDYPVGQYRSIKGCQDSTATCNVVICKLPEHTRVSNTATFPNNPANTAFITLPPPPGAPTGSGYTTSSKYEILLRWVSTATGSQMAYTSDNKAVSDQDFTLPNGPCNPSHSGYNRAYHIQFRTQ